MAKAAKRTHPNPVARSIPGPKTVTALDPAKNRPRPAVKDDPIKVRAIRMGYYDHIRRREGDVFVIANEQAFSDKWMEKVDPRTRERTTSAPQALRQQHDEILGGKVTGGATGDADVLG